MFVDASAFCAVLLAEGERTAFLRLLAREGSVTSAIAVWETARAVERVTGRPAAEARRVTEALIGGLQVGMVSIGPDESKAALEAHERYGKGRHPAQLNLADCFAYACAKTNALPLLFKGEDFAKTDIETVPLDRD